MEEVQYCSKHSGVVATDVCSRCGKWICYNCRTEISGRIFCGARCVSVFLLKIIFKGIFNTFKIILKGIISPFFRMKKFSKRSWMELVLGLGLLISFFFIWKLSKDVKSINDKTEKTVIKEEFIDTTKIPPPKIFQPTEGGMVLSNKLDIEGEAEENRIVSLSIDGKLSQVMLPQKGKFAFKGIQLRRGQNKLEIRAITEQGKVSTLQTLILNYASPTLAYLVKDFLRGPINQKKVAITFDGGSLNNAAGEILDILKEYEIKSTFFVTGEFIRRYPKTVKRIVAEGHEVGNHTWSHPHLTSFAENRKHTTLSNITQEKIRNEFSKTASLFQLVTGKEMVNFWRAPYGEYNEEILRWAAEAGYKHIGWTYGRGWEETMDTLDWVADKDSKSYKSADEIVKKILNYARNRKNGANGTIILMHLGTNRKDDFPHKKLPDIINGLRKGKYDLVKVSEMTAYK